MRVLFALSGFHRHDRGAEVALLNVAEALVARGNTVTVMGAGEDRQATGYAFRHVAAVDRTRCEGLPCFPPFRNDTAWEDASFALNLLRVYDPAEFDIAVTCAFPFTHWALRRPAKRKPVQVFVTQNGDWPAISTKSEYRTFHCDGLVCTNAEYLARNERRWACTLIPNGVDSARFHPGVQVRQKWQLPEDKPLVLMVSALIASKRVADGIRAVAALDDAILVVAGDGPLRTEVEALAAQLLPGRFFRLSLPTEDMPSLYRSADVFLHLSLAESFGNVYLEAQASGLPVVGHDSAHLRWVLGSSSDFLCNSEDPDELRTSLVRALARGKVEVETDQLARFSWNIIAKSYQEFFEGLLAGKAQV